MSSAILFLIFNRPETTRQVFDAIRSVKPLRLYIAADGARERCEGEQEKCKEVRRIVSAIDWDCDVKTLFREENLGCKRAVSNAIDWFFDNEEEGIILEDDCVPDPSFFSYCNELLHFYRNDDRIMAISGDNFQFENKRIDYSYYFSRYNHVWGWATWRRAWDKYDVNMKKWPELKSNNWLNNIFPDKISERYWYNNFESVYKGNIDTWDYQWTFACWAHNGLTILPHVNLISNIGFDEDATHTKNQNTFSNMQAEEISFPLKHPPLITRNATADFHTDKTMFHRPLWKRIAVKIRDLIVK